MKKITIISFFLLLSAVGFSQSLSNIRTKKVSFSETIKLDSLSLIPNSVKIYHNSLTIDTSLYQVNIAKSTITFKTNYADSLLIIYRVLPYNLDLEIARYKLDSTQILNAGLTNPFVFSSYQEPGVVKGFSGIDKRGSISRGISFGNSQNVVVNSDLNLQLNGKLSDKVSILAAITDRNIPLQAEGNTQQLQEFDRVFIKIYSDSMSLIAGDFVLEKPKGYFLNYYKRGQGLNAAAIMTPFKNNNKSVLKTNVSASVAKGKFARNQIQGVEANQGPYRLKGIENEAFIIVLSGTERVYLNGVLLERGQNNDYTINYNTAEVTFTPTRLITKDSRISVEFEYSDKNYTRTMLATSNELKYKKMNLRFNYLAEQDSKNQPLLLDLTDTDKLLLNDIGDSLELAITPNIDSVAFNSNEVLYKRIDTLGIQVYVYSTQSDVAFYRVGFTEVGFLKGSYIQDISAVNGRVFKFVGLGIGNYEPISVLVSPKKQKMLTVGADYSLSKMSNISFEYALSEYDINTFSEKDSKDDFDNAVNFKFNNTRKLGKGWKIKSKLNYEHTGKSFKAFKRFRAVEFNRNWNLGNANNLTTNNLTNFQANFIKAKLGNISYSVENFNKANSYSGFKNNLSMKLNKNNYLFTFKGSYLNSDNSIDSVGSNFYRGISDLSKKYNRVKLGLTSQFEDNKFFNTDTVRVGSYSFLEWGGYLMNADSAINLYKFTYSNRKDDTLRIDSFGKATANNFALDYTFKKNPTRVLKLNTTYRSITNRIRTDESVLGRAEYKLNLYKGLVRSTTFYQVGSGRELQREYEYIVVPAGQGTHTWVDRDSNNVKTLDEFEIGNYADQRDHLRVFRQTNNFIKVFTNEFNQSLFLRANPKWIKEKGLKKVVSKFSLQSVFRITRKTNDLGIKSSLNPFSSTSDSSLQNLSSQNKHTLFFNRSNSKFGADLGFQDLQTKRLLNNGFEARLNRFFELKNRTAITKKVTFRIASKLGKKENKSEFFTSRNYLFNYVSLEPKVVYQPSLNFQTSISFDVTNKNQSDTLTADLQTIKLEARYNVASKSRLTFNLNYVNISYSETDQNTAVSYEMLESLRVGENIVWNLAFVKQLKNKMQISANYDGRKSEDLKPIHTGGIQVRAFF